PQLGRNALPGVGHRHLDHVAHAPARPARGPAAGAGDAHAYGAVVGRVAQRVLDDVLEDATQQPAIAIEVDALEDVDGEGDLLGLELARVTGDDLAQERSQPEAFAVQRQV